MKVGLKWISKFIPIKLCEIKIYKDEIKQLKDWYKDFENNKILYLYGETGCGKTTIIKLLLDFFNHKYIILNPLNINIPGDPSSAAFFTALTLLNKKSSLRIKKVGLNPTRIGFYELLKKSGAKIKFKNIKKKNNEVYGDILIASSKIKPIKATISTTLIIESKFISADSK